MCGIIYVKRKDREPAVRSIIKRYKNQKSRGQQGFGFVAIKNNRVVAYVRAQHEDEIMKALRQQDAPEILFHHRFPTSTPNVEESAHPLLVEHPDLKYRYYIAHNGVIRNTDELYAKHAELGFKYSTELRYYFETARGERFEGDVEWNDSESLAIETALALEEKKKDIETKGAVALIGLKLDGDRVVERLFYRNDGNPLKLEENKHLLAISSEGKGESVGTTFVYRLKDGGGYEPLQSRLMTPYYYSYREPTRPYQSSWETPALEERKSTPVVPPTDVPGHGRMGFGAHSEYEEEDFDAEEQYELTLPPQLTPENAKSVREIVESIAAFSLPMMTENELWDEYERVGNAKVELEDHLNLFDAWADQVGQLDADSEAHNNQVRSALFKLKQREEAVEREIQRRETERTAKNGVIHFG